MKITYIIILILVTLAVALWNRKKSPLCTPLLIWFLTATLVIEVVASVLKFQYDANNLWLYNIYMYIAFPFWFWQLMNGGGKNHQWYFGASVLVLFISALLDQLLFSGWYAINSIVFATGTLLYVLLFIIRIHKAYAVDDIILPNYRMLYLLSGLGFFVLFFFDTLLYATGFLSKPLWNNFTLDQILSRFTNYYFYLLLTFSIIISVNKKIPAMTA